MSHANTEQKLTWKAPTIIIPKADMYPVIRAALLITRTFLFASRLYWIMCRYFRVNIANAERDQITIRFIHLEYDI